jgi:glutathione synthase/RimK-type ligase-like ATP-grasp enzyme
MTDWLILAEHSRDLDQRDTPHKILPLRDYISNPELFAGRRPVVINLARGYGYQSAGYYASLLAEARGHRVLPTVQTMLDLSSKSVYADAIPDLEEILNRDARKQTTEPRTEAFTLLIAFGLPAIAGFEKFGRLLFDWYRCPVIAVLVEPGNWFRIKRLRIVPPHRLTSADRGFLVEALTRYCRRTWRRDRGRTPLRWSLAVLHNPREALPPTKMASMERLATVGARMGIDVEPIQAKDYHRLAEFDALFIRETTSVNDHTFRFARRAEQEGMPVIDDTVSMIRCTNKVYLKEKLEAAALPLPRTKVFSQGADSRRMAAELDFPMVIKIPDGSFSRGVHKVQDFSGLESLSRALFQKTDLLLAQEFMPTDFDWRIGVLNGEPLYACQYMMARNHWQIVRHGNDGKFLEGGSRTFAIDDVPRDVVDIAVKAAKLMGNGLYGVDLKQNARGVFIIEINDNPNLDSHIEGAVLKDELWRKLLRWFLARLEHRTA